MTPKTLEELEKTAFIDWDKVNATTDEDIERHIKEDDEDALNPSAFEVRNRLGYTQKEMANLLGVPLSSWQKWEQLQRPTPPLAKTLLRVLWYNPRAVIDVLHKVKVAA